MTRLVVGSATDVGLVRSNNQDQLLVTPGLYAVADGMGGHAAGEVASLTAIKALDAAFEASDERTASSLGSAARAANTAVWEQARTNRGMLGMGTTLVALAVVEKDEGTSGLAVAHIGDSRLYLYRDKALKQLTVDHSLVQELIDEGQISEAQAAVHPQRHVLTRALGVEPAVDVDLMDISPMDDDRYLLCSDGLPREASDEDIADVLDRFDDPSEAARELVALANSRGGSDNVTVVVVDVLANENSPDAMIILPAPAASGTEQVDDTATIEPVVIDDGGGPVAEPLERSREDVSSASSGSSGSSGSSSPFPRWVTLRVVGFVVALSLVLGGAVASVAWYARSAYFVTIMHGHIAIFQGRPGGVLWFQPTLTHLTIYSSSSVLPYDLQSLRSGQLEPSLGQANQYVKNLVAAKEEAELADQPPPRGAPTTTKTSPTTTKSSPTTTGTSERAGTTSPATAHGGATTSGVPRSHTPTTTAPSSTRPSSTSPSSTSPSSTGPSSTGPSSTGPSSTGRVPGTRTATSSRPDGTSTVTASPTVPASTGTKARGAHSTGTSGTGTSGTGTSGTGTSGTGTSGTGAAKRKAVTSTRGPGAPTGGPTVKPTATGQTPTTGRPTTTRPSHTGRSGTTGRQTAVSGTAKVVPPTAAKTSAGP